MAPRPCLDTDYTSALTSWSPEGGGSLILLGQSCSQPDDSSAGWRHWHNWSSRVEGSPRTAAWRPAGVPTGRLTIWPLPAGGGGHISYWHLIGTGKGLMVAGNLDQRSNLTYPTGIRIYHRHHNNNRTNTSQQRPDFLHIRKCPCPTAAARRRAVTSPFWLCAAVLHPALHRQLRPGSASAFCPLGNSWVRRPLHLCRTRGSTFSQECTIFR